MNGLDLFSGIGGISLALKPWVTTIAYCEQDRYAQGVLLSRMSEGLLDSAPIWDDVRTLHSDHFITKPDIIFGGFPCQDVSVAGTGRGLAGERSGLFYEIIRLTEEIKPAFVFLENVPAIRTRGLREVIRAFTNLRYDCRWTRISASSFGAHHKRERWFLLAHAMCDSGRLQCWGRQGQTGQSQTVTCDDGITESLAYTKSIRLEEKQNESHRAEEKLSKLSSSGPWNKSWWSTEPNVGRVVNGLPHRVDRIKCLGNAVVPIQAQEAFKRLTGIKSMTLSPAGAP